MKSGGHRRFVRLALASVALWLAALAPLRAPPSRAQPDKRIVLIVGKAATSISDVDGAMVRRAFEGHPVEYASGKRLVPFNAPAESSMRQRFDRMVLGFTPEEVGRFWVDQRIRGQALPPRTVASPAFGVRVVAALPGGITYVPEDVVNDTVRVLSVDGRQPGQAGYLLAPP